MVDELHQIACGVEAIKASRTIPMGLRRLRDLHAIRQQVRMPCIDIIRRTHDEADMVQTLRALQRLIRIEAMERDIILARCQVDIVWIRLPLFLHADHIAVEHQACLQVMDEQRDMMHAQHAARTLGLGMGLTHSGASTISKSWVTSAALPSMMEAEQYFSADNFTARST